MSGRLAASLALATLWAAGGVALTGAQTPVPVVRYVTLNVLHGGVFSGLTGRDQELEGRLEIVTEELMALGPDIVGLQEASTSDRRGNVARRLADRLDFHHVYTPALFRLTPSLRFNQGAAALMNFTEGPAILSRYPIVASETLPLPRCGRWLDPRVLLSAEVATPWGRLPVFSTHTSGDPCQSAGIRELVRARRGALPGMLMGDFNAVETSPTITGLTDGGGLLDAFRVANPTVPGFTVWQRVDTPEPTARRRVDYLFLVPGTRARGRVLASRVVLDSPRRRGDGSVLWPSDHYGVLADVAILPAAAGAEAGEHER